MTSRSLKAGTLHQTNVKILDDSVISWCPEHERPLFQPLLQLQHMCKYASDAWGGPHGHVVKNELLLWSKSCVIHQEPPKHSELKTILFRHLSNTTSLILIQFSPSSQTFTSFYLSGSWTRSVSANRCSGCLIVACGSSRFQEHEANRDPVFGNPRWLPALLLQRGSGQMAQIRAAALNKTSHTLTGGTEGVTPRTEGSATVSTHSLHKVMRKVCVMSPTADREGGSGLRGCAAESDSACITWTSSIKGTNM